VRGRRDDTRNHTLTLNAKAYTHEGSRADYMEFENRGHFICGQEGWQEVAGYIANWIEGKDTTGKRERAGATDVREQMRPDAERKQRGQAQG